MLIDEEDEPIQEYSYAQPGKRIFIALIELVNCWVLSYLAGFILPHVYERPLYLGCIFLVLAYKIISEKVSGQSFSKKMYKLEVVSDTMSAPTWTHVLKRNIIWIVLPTIYAVYFYVLVPWLDLEYPILFSFINLRDVFQLGLLIVAVDLLFVFFTPKKQALHDLIGGTIVLDRN